MFTFKINVNEAIDSFARDHNISVKEALEWFWFVIDDVGTLRVELKENVTLTNMRLVHKE